MVGFDEEEVFDSDDEDRYGVAGAGRPESWGVGVAEDIVGCLRARFRKMLCAGEVQTRSLRK